MIHYLYIVHMDAPDGPRMDFLWYATGPFLFGPHRPTNNVCGPEDLREL